MIKLEKGGIYGRDEIEREGLELYKELSSRTLIYKKGDKTYFFDKLKFENEGNLKLMAIH